MSAQRCPTCGAQPGMKCMSSKVRLETPHAARMATEHGEWTAKYDEKWRDKTLRFQVGPNGK